MSIIYDALNKTQKKRENKSEHKVEKKSESRFKLNINWEAIRSIRVPWKIVGAFSSVFLFGAILLGNYSRLTQYPPLPAPTPTPFSNFAQLNKLILNGVFLSSQNKLAMINNHYVEVGDTVEGLKVTAIEFNGVTLQRGERVYELKTPV